MALTPSLSVLLNIFKLKQLAAFVVPDSGINCIGVTTSSAFDLAVSISSILQSCFPHAHSLNISLNKTSETLTLTVNNREEDIYFKNLADAGYKLIDSVVPKNNNEHAAWKFAHADGKITVLRVSKSKFTHQTTYKITKNFHITKYKMRSYYTQLSI